MTGGRVGTVLDLAMPEWTWNEFHSIPLTPAHSNVTDVADSLRWNDVPAFRRIMRATSLGRVPKHGDDRVLDLFDDGPYVRAHHDAQELVYVGLLQFRPNPSLSFGEDPVTGFRDAAPPRAVRVAMNFLYRDGVLSTETRCQATDPFMVRAFSLYWLGIRVGSGVIRGSWLRGIRRRAAVKV